VRDLDEVRALGFRYFAPFAVVSHGNFSIEEIGSPVVIDGQEIRTGDILHGDANGIVIVPPETLDGLPEVVERIRTRERQMMDYVNGAEFTVAGARELSGY